MELYHALFPAIGSSEPHHPHNRGCYVGKAVVAVKDGFYHLLRVESMSKGVRVDFHEDGTITIELHIMVDNGVNLSAVGASIISEVRYVVTKCTGTEVRAVNVYIDSMMIG